MAISRRPPRDADRRRIQLATQQGIQAGRNCAPQSRIIALPLEEWTRLAFASGKYHEAGLTAEIVYVAQRLYAIAERGDRLIAATAVALDLPLITRDPQIAAAAGVACLWA